jgi:hypothetical protein
VGEAKHGLGFSAGITCLSVSFLGLKNSSVCPGDKETVLGKTAAVDVTVFPSLGQCLLGGVDARENVEAN